MTIVDIQEEIIEEFSLFDNKNDIYTYIIELGKKLEAFPEQARTEENLVKGCQSRVWLTAQGIDEKVKYWADSDSTLVKGLISLLVRVFSEQNADDILKSDLYFIDKIGLQQLLSMNRSNGLASMLKQMKFYAIAYQNV